ncbi:uncharacterized protein [Diabrotica undecimpunctata]|uniref:uncharacterized protein n=1 Tax=Diabrotica undecimpunctata TaxID=50387 RepID=UPI003B63CAB2
MPNIGGPSGTVDPPLWNPHLGRCTKLQKVQRYNNHSPAKASIKSNKCIQDYFNDGPTGNSGHASYSPPSERTADALYNSRDGHLPQFRAVIRGQLLTEWQAEWEAQTDKAQWTKKLIPNVIEWYKRKFKRVNFYFMQFLTGHGSFRSYTYQIRQTSDDNCVICNVEDDAEHCIFRCKVFASEQHIM